MIAQTNPKASYLAHKQEIDAAIQQVLTGGWYILGSALRRFEEAFAGHVGGKQGIGVANGTDAIELALRACEVGGGDVVFTVSHTAVATVVGVERTGATAVLVDIDPTTYTMDPHSLEKAIAAVLRKPDLGRPRAIVAVHLYGHPCDVDGIGAIARRHGLLLIEDCAQAHGASYRGRRVGGFGAAAAFSFYPTKNLGAIGDGGAVVTGDEQVAERCRMLREYGWRQRYISEICGVNSRLDELQAAILHAKLPHLDADNAQRQRIARMYDEQLQDTGLTLPSAKPDVTHVYHQYVIQTPQRERLREELKAQGVGTLVHYPMPVHLQPAYRHRLYLATPLEQTEKAAQQVLSLPMYPELQDEEVAQVTAALRKLA